MPSKLLTADLTDVVTRKSKPGITLWNRLEGRPRADNFERALRAEVRDALWMLTRQWQMGEFRGDDAGSPIVARVRVDTTRVRRYRAADGPVEAFDDEVPLEARVERMPVPMTLGPREVALDIRLAMGRYWLKLVTPLSAAARAQYVTAYPVHVPDPLVTADAAICAHQEAWTGFAAASRLMDGWAFFHHLTVDGGQAADGIPALAGLEAQADTLAERFVAWFRALLHQPSTTSAWRPERLEYQFECSAPQGAGEKVLVAEEYFQGHLDWYNFDVDPARQALGEPTGEAEPEGTRASHVFEMLPTPAGFNGMPNTRWWSFEDGRTNFGDVKPDTTDLAKLLLVEFALVHANDWFVVPFGVPAGSVATVRGVAVTNTFGERVWIGPAGAGEDDDWQRWAMFLVSVRGRDHQPADLALVIPPSAQKVLEGPPVEDVLLARDEMANMVWGIERTIWLPSGEPKAGREAALETRAFFDADAERQLGQPPQPPAPAESAKVTYRVMNTVPEHWIPFIAVHVPGGSRAVQLQRAAMLRTFEGDQPPPVPVRPRTALLRHGLDAGQPYLLHEQEVPRAGTRVTQAFQRTRWRNGRTWTWLGVRKQTGRGEGSSGLAFDRVIELPPRKPPQA